jgi:hypothetical protein
MLAAASRNYACICAHLRTDICAYLYANIRIEHHAHICIVTHACICIEESFLHLCLPYVLKNNSYICAYHNACICNEESFLPLHWLGKERLPLKLSADWMVSEILFDRQVQRNLWIQCDTPELKFLKCSIKWDVITFCFSPVSASLLHSFYSLENTTLSLAYFYSRSLPARRYAPQFSTHGN